VIFPKNLRATALCVAALVLLADYFFYDLALGGSLALYLWVTTALVWLRMPPRQRRERHTHGVTAAVLGLSAALIWNPYSLNILLSAAGLAVLAMGSKTHWRADPLQWLRQLLGFLFRGWPQVWRDSAVIGRWRESGRSGRSFFQSSAFGRKSSVPFLICGVFLVLFMIANPLVSKWIGDFVRTVANPLFNLEWPPLPRIFLWVMVLFYSWALFRYRPKALPIPVAERLASGKVAELTTVDTVIRSLILLNVLFALMNLLDLRYLWLGAALPDGMSYAEYAQRGAYPLVISALLAGFFVLITFRVGGAAEKSRWAVILVGLWVGQNILLTVSAGWRLGIYIDVYSLTRLRMAAAVWMALVACGLLWICLRILSHKSNAWLIRRNALTLGTVLYVCAFFNFDGYIARYNVERCEEISGDGAPLDWDYLEVLGIEVLPALRAVDPHGELPREFVKEKRALQGELERRLRRDAKHWQSWTGLRHGLREE
jgi:hypothetical protein